MKWQVLILTITSLVFLSGCYHDPVQEAYAQIAAQRRLDEANKPKQLSPWYSLQQDWANIKSNVSKQFIGKPLDHAFQKLGQPTSNQTIQGQKQYVWITDNSRVRTSTLPTTTAIQFAGQTGFATGSQAVVNSYDERCRLTLAVNENNIVVGHSVDGNIGGCGKYASVR